MGGSLKRDTYFEFALAYDQALGQRFFEAVSPVLDRLIRRHAPSGRSHLDLACGTGLAMQHLARSGYRSFGIDGSTAMLALARERGAVVAAYDLRSVVLRRTFDVVTCLYDSLNHLLETDDLEEAFRCARGVMDESSLFIFDLNHPQVYPRVWGLEEPFVSAAADHHLEMRTTYSRRTHLGHAELSGWAERQGKRFEIRETHQQRAYSERQIERALRRAELKVIERFDFDPYADGQRGEERVKIVYVARPAP